MSGLFWIRLGAIFMALTVALGAFGAHALKARLEASGKTDIWQTAVLYQFIHALGLFVVGWIVLSFSSPFLMWSGVSFVLGIILFSGSLYSLALGAPSWLGMVTPLGGLLFILAWLLLAFFSH